MTDDVQGLERGKWGWKWEKCGERVRERERDVTYSYLLVQHTRIYYFDEKADRTSTYPDGIPAEFAMGGRVRFWRVGCPFDVVMEEERRRREGEQKTEKGRSPRKGGVLGRQGCSTTEARRGKES